MIVSGGEGEKFLRSPRVAFTALEKESNRQSRIAFLESSHVAFREELQRTELVICAQEMSTVKWYTTVWKVDSLNDISLVYGKLGRM